MTTRQIRGIGFFITAALFAIAGVIFTFFPSTPSWVDVVFQCVTAVTTVVGIVITVPTITST